MSLCATCGEDGIIVEWRCVAVIERDDGRIISAPAQFACGDSECLAQLIARLITHIPGAMSVNVLPWKQP